MKIGRLIFVLAALIMSASAADVDGKWKVRFLGDPMKWPKMVSQMTFDLKAEGKQLTGMAHMANWPGDAPILDGEIDGDRISFVVVGASPWRSSGPHGAASGFPRLRFTGKIDGSEIKLQLLWDSVMIYGVPSAGTEYQMAGTRVPY